MLQASRPPPQKTYQREPAFQVMILGSSGGPREDNVTGALVRSLSTQWQTNSLVAVDGGTLLGGIIRCLELSDHEPAKFTEEGSDRPARDGVRMRNGAFEGLTLPHKAAESNGAWIFRHLVQSVLVTHAHLDHCSALALNTPLIESEMGPKVIGALPSVIAALKDYIFNDVVWPNLSDEDDGAGLVTYQRLTDGGNPMLGRGIGKGYVESCKGIMAKAMSISHGKSRRKYNPDTDKFERLPQGQSAREGKQGEEDSLPDTPVQKSYKETWAAVDSSAFFLLDVRSGAEILVFGDLEPDCVSILPRNAKVWREAAAKLAAGALRGIFVECSYPDAVDDSTLYGHMCPRHLIEEMSQFARFVKREGRRRKKKGAGGESGPVGGKRRDRAPSEGHHDSSPRKRRSPPSDPDRRSDAHDNGGEAEEDGGDAVTVDSDQETGAAAGKHPSDSGGKPDRDAEDVSDRPLAGLKVFIVHIKEELLLPDSARDRIMDQLHARNREVGLGCDFVSLLAGEVVYL